MKARMLEMLYLTFSELGSIPNVWALRTVFLLSDFLWLHISFLTGMYWSVLNWIPGREFHRSIKFSCSSLLSVICPMSSSCLGFSGSQHHLLNSGRSLAFSGVLLLYYSMPKNTLQARPSIVLSCFLSLRDQCLGLPDANASKTAVSCFLPSYFK